MTDPCDPEHLLAEGRALRALARWLLGPAARGAVDADDLAQEAQLAAASSPGLARRPAAWIHGALRNLANLLRRRDARRRSRERLAAQRSVGASADPAAIAQQAELARDVAAAVQALEEPFRTVVVLRFWRDLPTEAIAAQLGVPPNTVRSRLQRGLERLRARLDARHGSRASWAVPLGGLVGLRDGAVGTAAAAGVVGWTLGGLMYGKVLVGAAVAAAAAVLFWSWPAADVGGVPVGSGDPAVAAVAAAAGNGDPAGPGPAREPQRDAVAGAASGGNVDEPPFDPAPVRVAPWTAEFLVVDGDEMPVPGATVAIWPGKKVERDADVRQRMGGPRHSYQGRDERLLQSVVTDLDGCARSTIDIENVVVAAAMAGFHDSRQAVLWHTRAVPTTLKLVTEKTVHGVVLHADGTPAPGAVVTAGASGDFDDIARNPEPTTTDAQGRFALAVQQHGTWVFRARLAGQDSFYRRRTIREDRTELVLQFPGAIVIAGRVVDPAGRPVAAAEVKAWREPPRDGEPAEDDEQVRSATSDARGEFVLPVRSFARYQLLASAAGHCASALVEAAPSAAQPHVDRQLTLQAALPIRGRAVLPDEAPLAGATVWVEAEAAEPEGGFARPGRRDLFGDRVAATTAADGSFALAVHPGTTWTLSLRPDARRPLLVRELRSVAPGTTDLDVKLTAADLRSCIVRGTVVRAADGGALADFGVTLVTYGDRGPIRSGGASVRIDGNRFETEPLPVGQRFGFWVEPKAKQGDLPVPGELGWTEVAPFETSPGVVELEVRVGAWGELPLRVLGPGDQPVRNARVRADAKAWFGRSAGLRHVDGSGRVVLRWLGAGTNRLVVLRGANEFAHEQDVTITPGRNPEIVVRLPR